jgi:hypothetical protein
VRAAPIDRLEMRVLTSSFLGLGRATGRELRPADRCETNSLAVERSQLTARRVHTYYRTENARYRSCVHPTFWQQGASL